VAAREGIAVLDLTTPLESALARGESPYFADDTHWNAVGHRVAAEAIAADLRARGWDRD
jgi:lysophospholipase L1-like esterase